MTTFRNFLTRLFKPAPRRRVLVLPRKPDYRDPGSFFDFGGGWIAQRITLKSKKP